MSEIIEGYSREDITKVIECYDYLIESNLLNDIEEIIEEIDEFSEEFKNYDDFLKFKKLIKTEKIYNLITCIELIRNCLIKDLKEKHKEIIREIVETCLIKKTGNEYIDNMIHDFFDIEIEEFIGQSKLFRTVTKSFLDFGSPNLKKYLNYLKKEYKIS